MPEPIDLVFRTVAAMSTILLAGYLAVCWKKPAALPGIMFCLAVVAFFITSTPGHAATLGVWDHWLTAICVTKAVWFWLFARALFNDNAPLQRQHLVIVATVAIAGTWQQNFFLNEFRAGTTTAVENVFGFGFEALLMLFVLLGLYEASRDLSVDLIERRRRIRVGFLTATGLYLGATLIVQSYNLLFETFTPQLVSLANMTFVAIGALTAIACLLQFRRVSWLDPAQSVHVVALNPTETAVLEKLEEALQVERIYLQDGLTIRSLADRLGTREGVLRAVINRGMGYRNFNDFLHAWRIREACRELAQPEQARQPVLSIALKVGYGSIGAFNRAFKSRIGMTPTAYRRNAINGALQAP